MPSRYSSAVFFALGSLLAALPAACAEENRPTKSQVDFFEKTIRPLLLAHCFECHAGVKHKGGLRLDTREAMMAGGDSGHAIVPGKPEESLVVKAINHNDEPKMPPKTKLKPEQIAALTKWIKEGAVWPTTDAQVRVVPTGNEFKITQKDREFWSFKPITDPPIPAVRNTAWPKNTIDYFILAKHEVSNLHSVGWADKRALIRRATFDLIGLPPTPEEIDAFLHDNSTDAFAKVVDRLLASPHYGERWARHWLDVARYGEDQAHTFQARKYPNGYRYRDWLIKAFNDDLPYDRFIREQIAADLLDEPNKLERLPALGFFALGPVYYGDPKKLDQYDDRIDTLGRGFLGLTVACARCHDHKFDPIATKDYYGLAGIFASTDYEEVYLAPPEVVEEAKKKQTDDDKKKKTPLKLPSVHAIKDSPNIVTMKVHVRGNPATLGDDAPRKFLSILDSHDKGFAKGSGRLELAEAIASKDNPLTARVLVNRIWQHHFGKGLVRTPSNFGQLGERPTHPELLDHLATRLIQSGWSIKALHRAIMLSATYQQASNSDSHDSDIDGDNKLLWRMNRRRLEVEAWRDAMLAVSSTLDPAVGGPSTELADANNRRRTLYGFVSRHELNSLLRLFDFPDPNITNDERTVTTVPLQQLFVLNSEFMVRNAKALAARLNGSDKDDASRIRRAFQLLYGRAATEPEVQLGTVFLASAKSGPLSRWEQYAQVLLSASEFLYVD
jgi:mono/diheme cytochrome c family protein